MSGAGRHWRVTGRRVPPPTFAVMGKTRPVQIDGAGSTVAIWANARGVWAVVRRGAGATGEWVEIAVNPECPPDRKSYGS